ncbi:MAG: PAS domain-containing sensor histidine kinase [Cyclobacteriaceae bacterium]
MSTAKSTALELQKQYENIFEFSPYAIFVHDLREITNVNNAFLRTYGYDSKDEIIGLHPIRTLVFPEDITLIQKARKAVKEGESFLIPNVRLLKKDGSHFTAECHVSVVGLGDKVHHQIHAIDVTEAVKSQQSLLESGKRYRTLFDNSLDGIYKSTPDGRFVDVNQAMVDMLGYSSIDELLAIDIKTQLYFKIEDRKIMAAHEEDQYPLKKKNGSLIWVEDHSYYEYDDEGNILFHHGVLRDVTGKLEKQKELEELLKLLEDQNERLQSFAHIISHNIRSHSANLSSLVHFMEENRTEVEKASLFEMLKTSTSKLEETIQNLNEIITVNRNLNQPREFRSLSKEVDNTLKILSGDIMEAGAEFSIKIPLEIEVHVIPAYLDSILLNLISNAIKYKSESRPCMIEISAHENENEIILDVSDNGIGIDLERNHDKLFRMYETFSNNTDSRGFGLYITKNQIESMDGQVKVKSQSDVGSTFSIHFNKPGAE